MERNIQGVKINNDHLAHWNELLWAWIALTRRYCDFIEDEAPYYHTERANIGIVAGAAWNAGWISLEEFGARKRGIKQGRCDLYIYPSNKERGEYIEAKHSWHFDRAESGLDLAISDARNIFPYKGEAAVKIGVLFISH
jgi:hypothetical protein